MPLSRWLFACAVVAVLASARAAGAQDAHVLGATATIGSVSARDDLLVPIASTGPGLALQGRYQLSIGSERIDAELAVGAAPLFDRFGNLALQIAHTAALGYAHVVQRSSAAMTQLGASLRWQTELSYIEAWDDAHGYWLSTLAVGPTLRHGYALSRALALETRGEIALLGLMSRPPRYRWNKQDALPLVEFYFDRIEDGEPFWLLDAQLIRLESLLRLRGRDDRFGTGLGVGPSLRFARAGRPEPYLALYAGISLDYGWQL